MFSATFRKLLIGKNKNTFEKPQYTPEVDDIVVDHQAENHCNHGVAKSLKQVHP